MHLLVKALSNLLWSRWETACDMFVMSHGVHCLVSCEWTWGIFIFMLIDVFRDFSEFKITSAAQYRNNLTFMLGIMQLIC